MPPKEQRPATDKRFVSQRLPKRAPADLEIGRKRVVGDDAKTHEPSMNLRTTHEEDAQQIDAKDACHVPQRSGHANTFCPMGR